MAPSKAKKLQHPKRRCSGFFFFLGRCPNAEEMEELYMSIRDEVIRKHKTYNLQSWSAQGNLNPKAIEKAEGIYIYDYDGTRYSDMSSQLVNMNVGHGNKEIADAIKEQAD